MVSFCFVAADKLRSFSEWPASFAYVSLHITLFATYSFFLEIIWLIDYKAVHESNKTLFSDVAPVIKFFPLSVRSVRSMTMTTKLFSHTRFVFIYQPHPFIPRSLQRRGVRGASLHMLKGEEVV